MLALKDTPLALFVTHRYKKEKKPMNIDLILQEISEASVYALLMVLGFVMLLVMYKFGLNKIESIMKTSIDTIERSYKNAYEMLSEYVKTISK